MSGSSACVEILTAKRKQNIEIVIAGLAAGAQELSDAVASFNAQGLLALEDIVALSGIAPTADEAAAAAVLRAELVENPSVESSLSEAERFAVRMSEIDHLDRKLKVLSLMALFQQLALAVRANVDSLRTAAEQVLQSPMLRRCLQLCLQVGNVLNGGTARGNARGFRLDVLPSLSAVKSSVDPQYSLMNFVAELMQRKASEALPDGEGGDAIDLLSTELSGTASFHTDTGSGGAKDWIRSIDDQIAHIKATLVLAKAELALLPPCPAAPALAKGYPQLRAYDQSRLLLSVATDEVASVWWVLLPGWRQEPNFHSWGKKQRAPRAEQVKRGVGADGQPALAAGCLVSEAAGQEHHVLIAIRRPIATSFTVYAVVEDSFGWETAESCPAASAPPRLPGAGPELSEPWRVVAEARISGRRAATDLASSPARSPAAPAAVEEACAQASPASVRSTNSTRSSQLSCPTSPHVTEMISDEQPPPDAVESCPGALSCVRRSTPGTVRLGDASVVRRSAANAGDVVALLRRLDLLGLLRTPLLQPLDSKLAGSTAAYSLNIRAWRVLRASVGNLPRAWREVERQSVEQPHAPGTGVTKGHIDGLYARFLLDAFVAEVQSECNTVEEHFSDTQEQLRRAAEYLGHAHPSQTASDHVAMLSTVRAFVVSLAKSRDQNVARERLRAQTEVRGMQERLRAARVLASDRPARGRPAAEGKGSGRPRDDDGASAGRGDEPAAANGPTSSPQAASPVAVRYEDAPEDYF